MYDKERLIALINEQREDIKSLRQSKKILTEDVIQLQNNIEKLKDELRLKDQEINDLREGISKSQGIKELKKEIYNDNLRIANLEYHLEKRRTDDNYIKKLEKEIKEKDKTISKLEARVNRTKDYDACLQELTLKMKKYKNLWEKQKRKYIILQTETCVQYLDSEKVGTLEGISGKINETTNKLLETINIMSSILNSPTFSQQYKKDIIEYNDYIKVCKNYASIKTEKELNILEDIHNDLRVVMADTNSYNCL